MSVLFILSFGITQVMIKMNEKQDEEKDYEYIVVLGARLYGENISPTLRNRLEKSLEVVSENENAKIIVTGGQGPDEDIAEAKAMQGYLIENGVDRERILVENKSTSTMENLKYARKIIENEHSSDGNIKIAIVTNEFHMYRSKILAKRNGFIPYSKPSKSIDYMKPKFYFREYFAVLKSIMLDW